MVTEPLGFATFPPGTVLLDKYRIIRELGMGGMGIVLCAEHVALGTRVAMKFLLPEFAILPDAAQRFVREARAATRVSSPHIAQVIDVGTLPTIGVPYMVMEYLDGQDLLKHLRSGREFSIHEAIDFMAQAAHALAQAHHVGIIHRDVKPANIMVCRLGGMFDVAKLLDFGLVKAVDAKREAGLTAANAVMGTPLYMSPETIMGSETVDARSDLYSLGCVGYFLLTGATVFNGESFGMR